MNKLALILACSGALVLAACATPHPPATLPSIAVGCTTFGAQAGLPQFSGIRVLSSDLTQMIGVQEFFLNRNAMGMVSANTTAYNCTDLDVHLLFRSHFSGDRGETEAPSAWRSIILPPRGARNYGESAINAATTRVSIDIADGNRGQMQFGQPQLMAPPVTPAAPATPSN